MRQRTDFEDFNRAEVADGQTIRVTLCDADAQQRDVRDAAERQRYADAAARHSGGFASNRPHQISDVLGAPMSMPRHLADAAAARDAMYDLRDRIGDSKWRLPFPDQASLVPAGAKGDPNNNNNNGGDDDNGNGDRNGDLEAAQRRRDLLYEESKIRGDQKYRMTGELDPNAAARIEALQRQATIK